MNRVHCFIAAALAGLSACAIAHGDESHDERIATTKKEQRPWGIGGEASTATRTIELAMTDNMRFTPDRLDLHQGETVRFVVRNAGHMLHELVIGSREELASHAALMARFPNMEHEEPYMVHVRPGASGEIVWTFNRPGTFEFACLIAGHFQAGMRGTINVATMRSALGDSFKR